MRARPVAVAAAESPAAESPEGPARGGGGSGVTGGGVPGGCVPHISELLPTVEIASTFS